MKKIRLDLEALEIVSFPTSEDDDAERGTVHGRATQYDPDSCPGVTCGYATCASGCSETDGVRICKSCGPCCYE